MAVNSARFLHTPALFFERRGLMRERKYFDFAFEVILQLLKLIYTHFSIFSPLCISNYFAELILRFKIKKTDKMSAGGHDCNFFVHEFELQFYPSITQWVSNSFYIYQDFQVLLVMQISGFSFPSTEITHYEVVKTNIVILIQCKCNSTKW